MGIMLQSIIRCRNIESLSRYVQIRRKLCTETDLALKDESKPKTRFETERRREKKTYHHHFVENLFLGLFECEVLEYPQIRTIKEVDQLQSHRNEIDTLVRDGINIKQIESPSKISKDVLQLLKENHLLGMKLKLDDKGLGYFESETGFIQESLALNSSLCKAVAETENVGQEIARSFENEDKKSEYISKCLNGELIVSLAHKEDDCLESFHPSKLSTTAVRQPGEKFVISGKKTSVYNPNSADVLIVSATTNTDASNVKESYSLFMIDKNAEGVSILEPMNTIGLRDLEICEVVFDNVIVPESSIVGKLNEGSAVMKKILKGKLSSGPQCIGLARKMLNELVKYCISKSHFNKPLYKYKYVQGKIGEMTNALYAAESITYLLMGRLDECDDLDTSLESLIVKVYTSEALNFVLQNSIQFFGREETFNNEFTRELINDSYFFSAFDEPNGHLKVQLATAGVKHVVSQLKNKTESEYQRKSAMELFFFQLAPRKYVKLRNDTKKFLNLVLEEESTLLEYTVAYLQILTETAIRKYGDKVFDQTNELILLSEIAIEIYKMAGVFGRASRSLCIGLRYAELEQVIARSIAMCAYQRALTIVHDLEKRWKTKGGIKDIRSRDVNYFDFIRKHPPEFLKGSVRNI